MRTPLPAAEVRGELMELDLRQPLRLLDFVLAEHELPLECLPSVTAASRALKKAIAHLEAACAVADHLAAKEVQ